MGVASVLRFEVQEKKGPAKKEKEPKFKEEHRVRPERKNSLHWKARRKGCRDLEVLWTDLGKIIGRQGMNLKIIKAAFDSSQPPLPTSLLPCEASIGCEIQVPRQEKVPAGREETGRLSVFEPLSYLSSLLSLLSFLCF